MTVTGNLGGIRRARILLLAISLAAGSSGACARCDAPPAPAPPEAPPPPPPPPVRDAGVDVSDARGDASDASAGPARRGPSRAGARGGGGSGSIKIEGLPKGDAEKVVRAGMARLRACNPSQPGRVMIRLEIDDRGHVTLGEVVRSTLASGDSELCMVRATRDFKFPAAAGGGTVTFPIVFGR